MKIRNLIQRDPPSANRQFEPTPIEHQIKSPYFATAETPKPTNKNRTSPGGVS